MPSLSSSTRTPVQRQSGLRRSRRQVRSSTIKMASLSSGAPVGGLLQSWEALARPEAFAQSVDHLLSSGSYCRLLPLCLLCFLLSVCDQYPSSTSLSWSVPTGPHCPVSFLANVLVLASRHPSALLHRRTPPSAPRPHEPDVTLVLGSSHGFAPAEDTLEGCIVACEKLVRRLSAVRFCAPASARPTLIQHTDWMRPPSSAPSLGRG